MVEDPKLMAKNYHETRCAALAAVSRQPVVDDRLTHEAAASIFHFNIYILICGFLYQFCLFISSLTTLTSQSP